MLDSVTDAVVVVKFTADRASNDPGISAEGTKDPNPKPLTEPIESSNGLTRPPYANFVCAANAVKVADAVLMIVIE
jgi:hypothetical protein